MRRLKDVILAAMLAAFLVGPSPATATELNADANLREALRAQGEIIQQLRDELGRVREDQRRNEDRVRALEDQGVNDPTSGVDAAYVDRRIEAFQTSDESRLFLSGYGKAEFRDSINGGPSTFNAQFNPIMHFRLTDRLHFNAELEFELEDGETEIELEFAAIDYFITDWMTFTAGKFLTPFNVFGQKLHPPWINKLNSRPLIYAKKDGIIPILGDVGVMLSGGAPLWNEDSKFNYAVYVSNGPKVEDGELEFENAPDVNSNKAFGGRIGFLPIPNLEVGFSGMSGRAEGRFDLIGADFWWQFRGLEVRGEFARLDWQGEDRWGYYTQAAYALDELFSDPTGWSGVAGRFEPVVRWSENLGDGPDREQVALGLAYWLFPSVPLKFTYELNGKSEDNDRYILQFAYGF